MKKVFYLYILVFSVFLGLNSCSTEDEKKEKTDARAVVSESISVELKSGTKNTLVVSWKNPKDDGGEPITGYKVRYYHKGHKQNPKTKFSSKETFPKTVEFSGNIKGDIITVEIDISKFPPNTVYVFEIIAKKADGEITLAKKEYTTAKDKPVPPSAPKNIEFKEVNDKSLKVIWEKPDSNGRSPITKYTVEYAEGSDASSISSWKSKELEINKDGDNTALELEIDGLEAGKEYLFRVAAVNKDAGNGDYSDAVVHKTLAIGEPLNLKVSNLTNTSFTLGWDAIDYPEGYTLKSYSITKVYDDENGQEKLDEVVSDISNDKTSYDITGLEKGKTYKFVVASIFEDADGNEGKDKNTIEVTMVMVALNSVSLDNDTLDLRLGKKKTLKATIAPPNDTNQTVRWSSSDPAIATVDANGKVSAVAVGSTTITVTTEDGTTTDTCTLTVFNVYLNNLLTEDITIGDKNGLSIIRYGGIRKDLGFPSTINGKKILKIGDWAFYKKRLRSVHIPNGVIVIGDQSFGGNQLTSVNIPNSVTTIGMWAFYKNQLTDVTIGKSVKTIGRNAFSENKLTSLTLGNSIINIANQAFYKNQLTSLIIPDNVKTIGKEAFAENKLTSLIIPDSVKTIGKKAFARNKLISLTLGDNVTNIGWLAFYKNQLTSLIIPDSVTTIGGWAFRENKLTSLKLGDNVKYIEGEAFRQNKLASIEIPDSVTIIDSGAFSQNQLTSVDIPDSVTTIGMGAFAKNNLTRVTLGNSLTEIASYCFDINSLEEITIPSSVKKIGLYAFKRSRLRKVILKRDNVGDLTSIHYNTFSLTPIKSNNITRNNSTPKVEIVVPKGTLNAYKKLWKNDVRRKRVCHKCITWTEASN